MVNIKKKLNAANKIFVAMSLTVYSLLAVGGPHVYAAGSINPSSTAALSGANYVTSDDFGDTYAVNGTNVLYKENGGNFTSVGTMADANGIATAIAVDGLGNVYIVNSHSNGGYEIEKYDGSTFTSIPITFGGDVASAAAVNIVADDAGNIWFSYTDTTNNEATIAEITAGSTTLAGAYSEAGLGFSQIAEPIAADPNSGNLWLEADTATPTYELYDFNTVSHVWSATGYANPDNSGFISVSVDQSGNVWAVSDNNNVSEKTSAGNTLNAVTMPGSSDSIAYVYTDSMGNVWMVDQSANKTLYELPVGGNPATDFYTVPVVLAGNPTMISVDNTDSVWVLNNSGGGQIAGFNNVLPTLDPTADIATDDSSTDLSAINYNVPSGQTLNVNDKLGNVEVQSGATLKGNGTVAKLTVDQGGTVAPGDGPSCLTESGAFALDGNYSPEIGGTTATCTGAGNPEFDQIIMAGGALTFGANASITPTLTGGFVPTIGDTFNIISGAGSPIATTNMPTSVTNDGVTYSIAANGGNVQLTVTAVNQAAAAAASSANSTTKKTPKTPDTGLAAAKLGQPLAILFITSMVAFSLIVIAKRVKPAVK